MGASFLFLLIHLLTYGDALNNGVARTPPMGFNTYYAGMTSEEGMLQAADWLVSSGLAKLGYLYVNSDAGWSGSTRNATTGYQSFNLKAFPDGFPYVCDQLHQMGLKCGIYSALSSVQCDETPGSLYYENTDAKAYAEWQVDYLKYDNCAEYALDWSVRTAAMRDALNRTKRPIVFSYEPFAISLFEESPKFGNLARTTKDISASWSSITERMDLNDKWAEIAGNGYWNDPDMLQVGNGMSLQETRTQFILWSVMKSPLILSPKKLNVSSNEMALINNTELIAVNQDMLGVQGKKLSIDGQPVPYPVGIQTCSAGTSAQTWNLSASTVVSGGTVLKNQKTGKCLAVSAKSIVLLPCNSSDHYQVWIFDRGQETISGFYNYGMGSSAVSALAIANSTLYTGAHGSSDPQLPDFAYGMNLLELQTLTPEPPCSVRDCQDYYPPQMWYYDPVDMLFRSSVYVASINHCFEGDCYDLTPKWPTTQHYCLAAINSYENVGTKAGTLEVWGGPLSNGDYVQALVNRGSTTSNIEAKWSMLGVTGIGDSTCFLVRDMVSQKDLGSYKGGVSLQVASHDTAAIRLTKSDGC